MTDILYTYIITALSDVFLCFKKNKLYGKTVKSCVAISKHKALGMQAHLRFPCSPVH